MGERMTRITDLKAPEVALYTDLNEKQVKRIYEPETGIFICESIRVIERALTAGYEPVSLFLEEKMAEEVAALQIRDDIPVYVASYEVMKEITGYALIGGVLAAMRRKPLQDLEGFLSAHQRIVVFDDIENPTNVGAIFRSAAALGADGVILTEGSADPLYRRAIRVSMGNVFQIAWTYADDTLLPLLKETGFETYALALREDAVSLRHDLSLSEKKAVILGNEDHGISEKLLSGVDHVFSIPMQQDVDSLNVAAASAIAFWELFGGESG